MKTYKTANIGNLKNPVVTVGTFDGIHKGHQKIIDRLKEIARQINGETVVFTFWPHPRMVVNQENSALQLLNTLEEKKELMEEAGIEHFILYPFTKEFSQLSSEHFIDEILVKKVGVKYLVVGHDHRFGSKREGDIHVLDTYSKKYGFDIEQIDVINYQHFNVSSTQIREALRNGNVTLAKYFLGYPYRIKGTVKQGNKLGQSIGFPTANLDIHQYKLIPGNGVYVVNVYAYTEKFHGMANIGNNPTVSGDISHKNIEIHILNFNANLYGESITVEFIDKIRDERKFADMTELKYQLQKDKRVVSEYFKNEAGNATETANN